MNIRMQCFVELNVPNPGPLKIKHKDEMRCAKDSLVEVTEEREESEKTEQLSDHDANLIL